MRPNFGARRAQARRWLHRASQRCGEIVCLLVRTIARFLIRMQDGPLWKAAQHVLASTSHWYEIQVSKRRARYVAATGVLLAVLGCAWGFRLNLHSIFHQTEIEQTDRAALDAIVKGIVDAGFSGNSDADHQNSHASGAANLE